MKNEKTKILHVLGGLDRGGVETWLMHILRNIDRSRFQIDFMVHTEKECSYDSDARELGSRIFHNPYPRSPILYAKVLYEINKKYGPYDVVHSHVHFYSGYVLLVARALKIPTRIAQSHTDTRIKHKNINPIRQLYQRLMRALIRANSTVGVGVSKNAAEDLFGEKGAKKNGVRLIYYGIDFAPFERTHCAKKVRFSLGVPEDIYMVGHVGRFVEPKNHNYILQIVEELFSKSQDTMLLLVGDGPLRHEIEHKAEELGIADNIIFTGVRHDIPLLMLGAMDLFLFPSLYEGLGIVLLEAQAAGLPCVISDVIPEEVDVIKENIYRISLDEAPAVWANIILSIRSSERALKQAECVELMNNSRFNIDYCVRQIEELYGGCKSS